MSLSSSSSTSPPSSTTTSIANKAAATGDNDKDNKLQIFLGGSCNPTTWRRNVAIPYLESNGISYYNPQVDNWTPEAVNSERHAKQNAQILLFVIDKQTRSTVSLVESAFMAGENKNLVLVIYPFEYNVISITDTCKQTSSIVETRSKLMKTSRTTFDENKNESSSTSSSSFLQSSSSCSSTTTSSTRISSASTGHESSLNSTIATRASSTRTNLTTASLTSKSESPNQVDEKSLNAIHEEAKHSSGIIKINDEVISLNEFQELKQARCMLQNLLFIQNIPMFSDIHHALKYVSWKLRGTGSDGRLQQQVLNSLRSTPNSVDGDYSTQKSQFDNLLDLQRVQQQQQLEEYLTDRLLNPLALKSTNDDVQLNHDIITNDIYLSLESDDQLTIESTIISILEEQGLTYHHMSVNNIIKSNHAIVMPKLSIDSQKSTPTTTTIDTSELIGYSTGSNSADSTKLAIEKEICAIRSSRVILFVITNKCRGLSIMVLASHFMALFRNNVVLCVQYLEEPCSIGGETLTKTAIADYNRGRVYLCDYAIKSQVPVFSTIREAIECCGRKCRHDNKN